MSENHVVIYRTGGWSSCRWVRTLGTFTAVEAHKRMREIEASGYKAISRPFSEHKSLGMPVGWTPECVDSETDTVTGDEWHTYHEVHWSRLLNVSARIASKELAI